MSGKFRESEMWVRGNKGTLHYIPHPSETSSTERYPNSHGGQMKEEEVAQKEITTSSQQSWSDDTFENRWSDDIEKLKEKRRNRRLLKQHKEEEVQK